VRAVSVEVSAAATLSMRPRGGGAPLPGMVPDELPSVELPAAELSERLTSAIRGLAPRIYETISGYDDADPAAP
jgi:hypothetical protein